MTELLRTGTQILKFEADWCQPCKRMQVILDKVIPEIGLILTRVDVDMAPEMAGQFKITSFPTLVVLKDGNETARYDGAASDERQVTAFIKAAL